MKKYIWGTYKPYLLYEYLEANEDPHSFGIFYAQNQDLDNIQTCKDQINKVMNISQCSANEIPQFEENCMVNNKEISKILRYKSSYTSEEGLLETNYRTNNGIDYHYAIIKDSKLSVTTTIKTVKQEDFKWSTLLQIKNNSAKNTQNDLTLYFYFRVRDAINIDDIIVENNTINIRNQFNVVYLSDEGASNTNKNTNNNNTANNQNMKNKVNNISNSNNNVSNNTTSQQQQQQQQQNLNPSNSNKSLDPEVFIYEEEIEDKQKLLFYTKAIHKSTATEFLNNEKLQQQETNKISTDNTLNQTIIEGQNEPNSKCQKKQKQTKNGKFIVIKLNIRNLRPLFHISYDHNFKPLTPVSEILKLMKTKETEFQQKCSQIFQFNQTAGQDSLKLKFRLQQILSNLISNIAILKLEPYYKTAQQATSSSSYTKNIDSQLILVILDKKHGHGGFNNGFQQQSLTNFQKQQQQQNKKKGKNQENDQNSNVDETELLKQQFLQLQQQQEIDSLQQQPFTLYNLGFSLLSIAKWDVEFAMLIMDSVYNSRDVLGKYSFTTSQDFFSDPLLITEQDADPATAPSLLFALEKIQSLLMKKYNNTVSLFPLEYREFFQFVAIPLFDGWLHEMVFAASLSKQQSQQQQQNTFDQEQKQRNKRKQKEQFSPQQLKKLQQFTQLRWGCSASQSSSIQKSAQQQQASSNSNNNNLKCTSYSSSGFVDLVRHELDSDLYTSVDYLSWTVLLADYLKMMTDLYLNQRRPSMQYEELSMLLREVILTNLMDRNATLRDSLVSSSSGSTQSQQQMNSDVMLNPGISYVNLVPFVHYLFFDNQEIFQMYGGIFQALSSKFGIASTLKVDKNYDVKSGLYSYRGGVVATFNYLMLKTLNYVGKLEPKFMPFYTNLRSKIMNTMLFNYDRNEKFYESYHPEEPIAIREGASTPVYSIFIIVSTEDY